ncbi:uncharacterized protein [Dermacentor albipictus]|uniref:uncharacterized protein isoform X2 n=1 Tax=Dermacentor albipictus TaxID=60249 RepID=UPI0031FC78EE
MGDDIYSIVSIRATRPNNRPLRGLSGSEYDRNRRMNKACNVSVGVCAAPVILALVVLLAIEYQKYSLEKARQQRARAKLQSTNSTSGNTTAGRPTHDAGKASSEAGSPPARDQVVFPAEAVLAGLLFNRRRFFFGRSVDSHRGPCVVAAPQPRCLVVWQGMPARFEDDFEYLAHSAGVTFSWTAHQAGHPWPSNVVRLTANTASGPGRRQHRAEEFHYGRSPGFGRSSLLAGVVRLSESSKLIVIDNQRVRLFPHYELLVRNPPGYPVERWHQCQDRCNSTEGAVFGGLEGGTPTLVGRAFFDGRFSPCKVVAVGCVLPGGQVALIFEFLVESRGVVFEWVDFGGGGSAKGNASDDLSGSPTSSPEVAEVTVGGALVGRSRPLNPDGRLLLGAVVSGNGSRLYACDVREPLPAPLETFQTASP